MSKADQTRAFIIEKTAPVFNMKGYAGTSLTDMTGATGLTKGSIYGNFASKDEVALAAFDYNLQKVSNIFSAEMSGLHSAKEKLMVYARVYNDFLKLPFPVGGCPILNTAIEADDTHSLLKKKASDAILSWKNRIMRLIQSGMENGEFRRDNDPEQVALTMIAMIEGGIMITKLTGKLNYRTAIMRSVGDLIDGL
ncbi:MAG: TetR/AcrR family transcriptional regulator [Puia sp.]|nr:TetR/AcrR family transcriptional regulator [Puia sp.]